MDIVSFLENVMPSDQEGLFNLCFRSRDSHTWHELWQEWPQGIDKIVGLAFEYRNTHDAFFAPTLFRERCSEKECVLPPRSIFCDVDNGDIVHSPLTPSVTLNTSPGRFQAGIKLTRVPVLGSPEDAIDYIEQLSRKFTYSITGSDKSGWPLGHKFRLPQTFNHKYLDGPFEIIVTDAPFKEYTPEEIELLDDADELTLRRYDPEFINNPPHKAPAGRGPHEILESIREQVPARVVSEYTVTTTDRSASLWALTCSAFRAGLSREEVYWLALHSANNKFSLLKYHAERELAKDVLRAEQEVVTRRTDMRINIKDIKKLAGRPEDKNEVIFKLIKNDMIESGNFVKTNSNEEFYIPRDTGRPIFVTQDSILLNSMLDIKYGLNQVETAHSYTENALVNYVVSMRPSVKVVHMSYHDHINNRIFVHTGTKDVFIIGPNKIEKTVDGSHGVLFPWQYMFEPWQQVNNVDKDWDWTEEAFGDLSSCLDMSSELAGVLLRIYLLFIFFRDASSSRPILAFFGQPGGGKSTTMNRINKILYGQNGGMATITNPMDYDTLVTARPFVGFDGVDGYFQWLPDKLSNSASVTDFTKRRLFSNNEVVSYPRTALIGVTAHAPKFIREDIVDRFILLNFRRLDKFQPETPLYTRLAQKRATILTAILNDLSKILATPELPFSSINFRVEDFVRIGERISTGLGIHDKFKAAMNALLKNQRDETLSHDQVLVTILTKYLETRGPLGPDEYQDPSEIFAKCFELVLEQDKPAFKGKYRSGVTLNRKLWTLHASLKEHFDINFNINKGMRSWRINLK